MIAIKFRALNEDEKEADLKEEEIQEVKVEQAIDIYQNALRLQQMGNIAMAKKIYQDLINSGLFVWEEEALHKDGEKEKNHIGLDKSKPIIYLYSLIMRNWGEILEKEGKFNESLDKYTMAATVELDDVSLWKHVGCLANRLDNLILAQYAYEQALRLNQNHWTCLESLVEVLYLLGDYVACREYLKKMLILRPMDSKSLLFNKLMMILQTSDYENEKQLETLLKEDKDKGHFQQLLDRKRRLCLYMQEEKSLYQPKELILNNVTLKGLLELIFQAYQEIYNNESQNAKYAKINISIPPWPELPTENNFSNARCVSNEIHQNEATLHGEDSDAEFSESQPIDFNSRTKEKRKLSFMESQETVENTRSSQRVRAKQEQEKEAQLKAAKESNLKSFVVPFLPTNGDLKKTASIVEKDEYWNAHLESLSWYKNGAFDTLFRRVWTSGEWSKPLNFRKATILRKRESTLDPDRQKALLNALKLKWTSARRSTNNREDKKTDFQILLTDFLAKISNNVGIFDVLSRLLFWMSSLSLEAHFSTPNMVHIFDFDTWEIFIRLYSIYSTIVDAGKLESNLLGDSIEATQQKSSAIFRLHLCVAEIALDRIIAAKSIVAESQEQGIIILNDEELADLGYFWQLEASVAILDRILDYLDCSRSLQLDLVLRYKWLVARYFQLIDCQELVVNILTNCEKIFLMKDPCMSNEIVLWHCLEANVIVKERVTNWKSDLENRLHIMEAVTLVENGFYDAAYSRLVDTVEKYFNNSQDSTDSNDRLRLLVLFEKICKAKGLVVDRLKCCIRISKETIRNIANNGFHSSMAQLELALDAIQEIFKQNEREWWGSFPVNEKMDLILLALIMIQMAQVILENPRQDAFKTFVSKPWIILGYILRNTLSIKELGNFMALAHQELGRREACNYDNGQFLRMCIDVFSLIHDDDSIRERNQCYFCLYNIKLESEIVYNEHHSKHLDFDYDAAKIAFDSVVPSILEKIKANTTIRTDQRDIILNICTNFNVPPNKTGEVESTSFIEEYLNSNEMQWTQVLENIPFSVSNDLLNEAMPAMYRILYFLAANIYFGMTSLLKSRESGKWEKRIDCMEHTIKYSKLDISINPKRADSWWLLAKAYWSLAESYLYAGSESIENNYSKIVDLIKRAIKSGQVHLTLLTHQNNVIFAEKQKELGNFLYLLLTRPLADNLVFRNNLAMDMEFNAVEKLKNNVDGFLLDKDSHHRAFMLCLKFFESEDTEYKRSWRDYLMAGKIKEKLSMSPEVILPDYVTATRLSLDEKDALEPRYRLIASIMKIFHSGYSKNDLVMYLTDLFPEKCIMPIDDFALKFLRELLNENKWFHKIIYRIAKLTYEKTKDAPFAKAELSGLFHLKQGSVKFWNIWTTGHELPGKFFLYAYKYVKFLIQLLHETQDWDTLLYVFKKIKKTSNEVYLASSLECSILDSFFCMLEYSIPLVIEYTPDTLFLTADIDQSLLLLKSILMTSQRTLDHLSHLKHIYDFYSIKETHSLYQHSKLASLLFSSFSHLLSSLELPLWSFFSESTLPSKNIADFTSASSLLNRLLAWTDLYFYPPKSKSTSSQTISSSTSLLPYNSSFSLQTSHGDQIHEHLSLSMLPPLLSITDQDFAPISADAMTQDSV